MQVINQALAPEALDAFRRAMGEDAEQKNRHERRISEREKRLAEREAVLKVLAGGARE